MNTRRISALAGTALVTGALLSSAALADITGTGDLTAFLPAGEFAVANGQTKGIAHAKTEQTYRICVDRALVSVPLKVIHDGKQAMVSPGDCADFQALNIEVAPGANLPTDYILVGRFHHLS